MQKIFEETKQKLEERTTERDETKRALDCTRTVLHATEFKKQEQVKIHNFYGKFEKKIVKFLTIKQFDNNIHNDSFM